MKPVLHTFMGGRVNPLDPNPDDIHIEDIAHSLACINRFNGHVSQPINVAHHSVYVAKLCTGMPCELQALLHDGAEAFLGDMTKWLKSSPEMTIYREAEHRVQSIIYKKFGCPIEQSEAIDEADRIMVRFEGAKGYGPHFKIDHPLYPPLTKQEVDRIGQWWFQDWHESKISFLVAFRKLTR